MGGVFRSAFYTTFVPLARRRERATSFVLPMLVIGRDEVNLKLQLYVNLKIKLAIVRSMAPSRGSKNPRAVL